MALVRFPDAAKVLEVQLEQQNPGQTVLRSVYGIGGDQILTRGAGRFAGQITFGLTDHHSKPEREDVERWLVEMQGVANTTHIPIFRPSSASLASGTAVDITGAGINAAGNLQLSLSAGALIPGGQYITAGGRLFIAVGDTGLQFQPAVLVPNGPVEWENPYIVARLNIESGGAPRGIPMPLGAEFSGPWTVPFIEAT